MSPVHGNVTVDGEPVPGLCIIFSVPGGRPSAGVADDAGNYVAEYTLDVAGVRPGTAAISFDAGSWEGRAKPPIASKIPRGYFREFMRKEIIKGDNVINFEIKSGEPAPVLESLPAEPAKAPAGGE